MQLPTYIVTAFGHTAGTVRCSISILPFFHNIQGSLHSKGYLKDFHATKAAFQLP